MENTKFKVYIEEKTQDYGKIFLEPLERGYGDTLGNALRRLLLSSIRGAAVTAVRIDGVLHEFSTIKGIREDVIEILMNLKQIPIKAKSSKVETNSEGFKIITLDSDNLPKDFFTRSENPGVITAKDMPWDSDFEFCGDKILCTLEPEAHLVMEIYVEQGVGYLSSERERPAKPQLPIDALLTDAIFSPVKRVNYQIEPARVGQSIDYERLLLEVWTNGAITPEEAVRQAADIAKDYFADISKNILSAEIVETDIAPVVEVEPQVTPEPPEENIDVAPEIRSIQDYLGLSVRCVNCLHRAGINVVGDLLARSYDDLLKIRNLGRKSLDEIVDKLEDRNLFLQPSAPQPADENTENVESESESDIFDDDDNVENKSEYNSFSSDKSDKELVDSIFTDAQKAIDEADQKFAETEEKDNETDSSESSSESESEKAPKKVKKTSSKSAKTSKAKTETKSKSQSKSKTKKEAKETKDKDDKVKDEAKAETEVQAEKIEEVKELPEEPKAEEKKAKKTRKTKENKVEKVEAEAEVKVKAKKEEKEKEAKTEPETEAKPEKKSKAAAKTKTTKSKTETKTKKAEKTEKPKKAETKSEKSSSKAKSKSKSKSDSESESESK